MFYERCRFLASVFVDTKMEEVWYFHLKVQEVWFFAARTIYPLRLILGTRGINRRRFSFSTV